MRKVSILSQPAALLTLCALGSLAIYVFAFVRPYNLFDWWTQPQLTIAKISDYDWRAGALYVFAFLGLSVLYALTCRVVGSYCNRRAWSIVIAGALAFNAALLWMYPADSADIFDNIIRGRMQAFNGANPFYQHPSSSETFQRDPFYDYAAWHDYPTAYGPGWEFVAAGVARLPGDGIIANVVAFKLLDVLAYAGTIALIALILRRVAPDRVLSGTTLFAWNPMVIYANAGNGHNDAVMIFFIVLGFFFLARKKFTLATLAQVAGALVKFIPILLVPVMMIAALKSLRGWRKYLHYLASTIVVCALVIVITYAPYYRDDKILGQDWRAVLFTTSLPTLFQISLAPALGEPLTDDLISRAAAITLAVWVAAQLIGQWKNHSDVYSSAVHASLTILLFYLLAASLWLQSWYATWVIAFAALASPNALWQLALLFSFVITFKMPIFDFALGVRPPNNVLPIPMREWGVTLGALGLPWFYAIFHSVKSVWLRWFSRQTIISANFEFAVRPERKT
jgi:glycosyl transferase family 87